MKIARIAAIWMTLGATAAIARERIAVCVSAPGDLRGYHIHARLVRNVVVDAFSGIGVDLEWRQTRGPCLAGSGRAIQVVLLADVPKQRKSGALASAFVYEGSRVEIFYERILACATPTNVPHLLAHTFIHEIAHILQGLDRHSPEGMMKAHWSADDRQRMYFAILPFSPDDVALIHAGIAGRFAPSSETASR